MNNKKNTLEIEVECPECDGRGWHEVGPECGYPASNCCGGCYHQESCDCYNGVIILKFEEDETIEIIKSIIRGNMKEAQDIINEKHFELCQHQ
tara:strand:+ start:806 stop:1084 length:279 start_codon:yes stop_codon:yes gene_type:complete